MKNVCVAIQLNHISEEELFEFQLSLNELGIDQLYYGLIPFSNDVTGTEEFSSYDAVVPFGTVKLVRLYSSGLLPKNAVVFYDVDRFDQKFYQSYLNGSLLNDKAVYTTLGKVKDVVVREDTFIKPSKDLKSFAGTVVYAGKTPGEEIFSKPQDSSLTDDETVLLSTLKNIVKEYRNFVVNGEIIDTSVYKIGSKITYEGVSEDELFKLKAFFNTVKSKYEPAACYVVDFALLDDGSLKVIEYNCIHCAGMYAIDRRRLFSAIVEYVRSLT